MSNESYHWTQAAPSKENRGVDVLGTKSTPLAVEINLPPYFLVQYF